MKKGPPIKDMTGQRFGRLAVIGMGSERKRRQVTWECLCDCGKSTLVSGDRLRSGKTQSCGCLGRERATRAVTKHGGSRRGQQRPEYTSWNSMIRRCTNPKTKCYQNYGGRGIKVCDRWRHDFAAFLADMGPRPSPKHSIDRVDNDGNYEPGNCRWATNKMQCRNQRKNRLVTANGITATVAEWAERTGLSTGTIWNRIRLGWTPEATVAVSPVERSDARYRNPRRFPLIKDIAGQRFGRWTVIKITDKRFGRTVGWECRCDCGTVKIVQGSYLRDGQSKSCGCIQGKAPQGIIRVEGARRARGA